VERRCLFGSPKNPAKVKKIQEKRKKSEKSRKMPKIAEMRKKVKNRTNHAGPNANPVSTSLPHGTSGDLKLTSFEKFQTTPNADKISQNPEDV
jgi:hypothetical protein